MGHPFSPSLEPERCLPGRNLKAKGSMGRGTSCKALGSPGKPESSRTPGLGRSCCCRQWASSLQLPRVLLSRETVGWEAAWGCLEVEHSFFFATANWLFSSLTKFREHQTSPKSQKKLINNYKSLWPTQLARKEPEPSSYTGRRRTTSQTLHRKWLPPHEASKTKGPVCTRAQMQNDEQSKKHTYSTALPEVNLFFFFSKAGRIMVTRKNKERVQVCWHRSRVELSWSRCGSLQWHVWGLWTSTGTGRVPLSWE